MITNSEDRAKALKFVEKFTNFLDVEYEKTIRYIINEILYNTLEHGTNGHKIPSLLQFLYDEKSKELSFMVADVGIGIKKHLRQTYLDLATDVEAILHAIKPQISGTFGQSQMGYDIKNNAGVGLYFSSNIVQRLNADMFIVSGNGFVHISPEEIISWELKHQWKGTFVYVKMKLGLIKDLNLQKMISEITKSIPKVDKTEEIDNLYISIRNYFGRYAENKDLAKKIRDEKLLPALAENKTLTIDFDEIVSAPHSLLNAMLATPIERLGLSAYKKIKIINAAPEIRETLDFIFDDNTSNA
ncbi:MAG: STAS-like domain-containing protein [Pyrinomonadaceae bacterium]